MVTKNKEYQRAYYENEANANKYMSYVNSAAGVLAIIMWVLYLTRVFSIPDSFFIPVIIMFPAIALIMFVPLFLVKTDLIRKPGYKYFILFSLLAVIMALNIALPKHSLLFWPFAVLIATHYYNPTIGRVIFAVSLVAMLFCLYAGMFFGEFDENLFGGGVVMSDGSVGTVDTFEERVELLNNLRTNGNNRYIKVLLFYFFPRAMIITLFFMVSNLLNRRTYKLLDSEIKIHDEQQKAKTELSVAKEIQINTLPEEFVDTDEVEIVGELKAAREVGGDLYDYLDIDENHVAVLIGDVSGKGVPAAMFMMKTLTSFRDFAAPNKTPSEILKKVNSSIFKGNENSMFVTCFLAILDKRNGHVVYSNAGHNPPVVGSNQNYKILKCNSGLLLGCFKECFLLDEEITLKPGESLTLYTDGITEARNINGEFFGEDRLLEVFNKQNYSMTMELHHAIKDGIASFVKDAPQSDDITFVTMKYQGNSCSFEEKKFIAKEENMPQMLTFIEEFSKNYNLPNEFINQLKIVGDELISNIVKHGYNNKGGEILVRLMFDKSKNEFSISIIDHAKPFNQLSVNNPTYEEGKAFEEGGLGLVIVKKIMSEYTYDYINKKNILVLKKKF